MTDEPQAKLLHDFIADEAAAFPNKQGDLWPSNHHRITASLGKVPRCLAPERRVCFYFHYLRVSGRIPPVSEAELPNLLAAYRGLLPHIGQGFPNLAHRLDTLFAFGFDEEGPLPCGESASAAELKSRIAALAQTKKYTSLPAQRRHLDRFKPYTGEAPRILQTFRRLKYQPDRNHRDYTATNLTFWGLALIALLNDQTRPELIHDLRAGAYDIPERATYLDILNAVIPSGMPRGV
jgi:hypothetical protein